MNQPVVTPWFMMGSLRLLFLLTLVLEFRHATSDCVMYGFCHSQGGLYQQCVYEGPPKLLTNSTGLELLNKYCPAYYNEEGETTTCCNAEQLINGIKHQVHAMSAVFKRCPSCLQNLITLACSSTCNPKQSEYIQLREVQLNEETYERYATSIDLYLSSNFMDGVFKSCSNVILPASGKKVLDSTCGSHTATDCTPERWFHFLGDATQNPAAPFTINFKRMEKPFLNFIPFNGKVYRCNEAPSNDSAACNCVDCLESCPADYQYSTGDYNFYIGSMDGVVLIALLIFLVLLVAFIIVRFRSTMRKRKDHNYVFNIPQNLNNNESVEASFMNRLSDKTETTLTNWFYNCGKAAAMRPTLVLALCSWAIAVCTYGILQLEVTSDPIKIWAAPDSRSRIEKDYFEERFGPFYRTEQIFIKPINLPKIEHNTSSGFIEFGPAFNKDFLLSVFELQEKIYDIPGLQELCFAPLSSGKTAQKLSECAVMSIWGYFKNDVNKFNKTSKDRDGFTTNYLDVIHKCLRSSSSIDCLAPYGGPVDPAIGVGKFLHIGNEAYEQAEALVITFLLNNYINGNKLESAIEWEKKFITVVKNWTKTDMPDYMDVAFNSEMSIEHEISKESSAEAVTIVISYLLMFIYVSLTLGSYKSVKTLLISSKILLGMGGILLVLASISSAVGIFGYMHVNTSLLTMEVIPFLILAVGVDNMFLLVATVMKNEPFFKDAVECIAQSVSEVGPSILLTTLSEAACFGIGAIVDMPAVRTFSVYAFTAIIINFLLQMTAFIAFLLLHLRRVKSNRLDLFFCVKIKNESNEGNMYSSFIPDVLRKFVAPLLLNSIVNSVLFLIFFGVFFMNLAVIPHIEPGLEQKLSMSKDSDVYKYFVFMEEILSIGPPVYFVLKPGLNLTEEKDQNLICGSLKCNKDSLNTQIFAASTKSKITGIRTPASSWLDDYFDWATTSGCCKMYKNGTFCPHSSESIDCIECNIPTNYDKMRPATESFTSFLPYFLQDNPDAACAKGGRAYSGAVNYEIDMEGAPTVQDTYFMSYHSSLKTSKDYYSALKLAREVAESITSMLNKGRKENKIEVFPYSVMYPFYEQYLSIWSTMFISLSCSLLAVFVVTFILTSFDYKSSLIVLLTVFMILIDLTGLMYWWSINLNAITLVNLVVAIGISVEFCSHIVHSFSKCPKKGKKLRAQEALVNTGSAVFAGITLTKFIGISVLAFSKTQIFQVFYFRMYLGMVLFGALHGLIFLPILLCYIGPDNSEKIMLRNRRNRMQFRDLD